MYFNYGIHTVGAFRFELNNIDSYEVIAKHLQKTNFREWTGLRHSVPLDLRNAHHNPDPSFKIDCGFFEPKRNKKTITLSLSVKRLAFFNWWGTEKGFFSSSFSCFWAISQGLSGSKHWTLYSTRIQNYTKSGTLQMIYVFFCKRESETMQHFFYDYGKGSNYITYLWQNNGYILIWRIY